MSGNKADEAPTTAFSIQSILSNKQFDGVWGALLSTSSSNCEDPPEYSEANLISTPSLSRAHRHFEWDSEALDMRMKSHLKESNGEMKPRKKRSRAAFSHAQVCVDCHLLLVKSSATLPFSLIINLCCCELEIKGLRTGTKIWTSKISVWAGKSRTRSSSQTHRNTSKLKRLVSSLLLLSW
ncbi:hypothetical protein Ocin01_04275 [Orchesella cincta]|uniref:Uncharacterized protein n=1 Tax=Orchesella cincta TaxID=48709 RepID=A0A1D2NAW3_ORCCI|nr:hypothetical protein Ocin01_04275 [Orchesella cincta]